jgi:hypothetical protein
MILLFLLMSLLTFNIAPATTFAESIAKEADINIFELENKLTIFVQLPKATESLVKWAVYLNNSDNLIKGGSLSSSTQVECICQPIEKKGSQLAFLILYNNDGAPNLIKKSSIVTTPRVLPVWINTLMGVIVGALLSLFTLLCKEEWTLRRNDKEQRIDTIGSILDYMERLNNKWLNVWKGELPPIQNYLASNSQFHSSVISRDSALRSELKAIEKISDFWQRTPNTNGEEEEKKTLQDFIEKYRKLLS